MAIAETPPQKKGPSLVVQAGVLVAITLLAVGGGWFAGMHLRSSAPEEPDPVKVKVEPVAPAEGGHGGGHGDAKAEKAGEGVQLIPRLVPLEPITTNLAAPADMWVRMEVSVVFSSPPSTDLVMQIHQDILAYMRTVTLQQIQGGSGFRHLKADLEERVQLRSGGLATRMMVRTLLFE